MLAQHLTASEVAGGFERHLLGKSDWRARSLPRNTLQLLDDAIRSGTGTELLKDLPDRRIIRWSHDGACWLIKSRRLNGAWYNRLLRRDPVYDEVINQLRAAARGLSVPAVEAVGRLFDYDGGTWSAFCMRWIPLPCMRELFLSEPNRHQAAALLDRIGYSVERLFRAACNHIDFGPHAILLADTGPADDVLIDFEYARFLPAPSPRVLAAQAGYVGWSTATNREWLTQANIREWFRQLFHRVQINITPELNMIFEQSLTARQTLRRRMRMR